MNRFAFVTCSTKPDFAVDDLTAVRLLEKSGASVRAIPWDQEFSEWKSFDKVVLRSCWNYHLHPEKFLLWLKKMADEKVNLFNSVKTVTWNLHKSYLRDLQLQNVLIPETVFLKRNEVCDLLELMRKNDWSKAVIKPAISATAHNTFLTSTEEASSHQLKFEFLLRESDLLVQGFISEVQQEGEWSLLFFNKKFSHAVLKKPTQSDFRVQNDFGGSVHYNKVPGFAVGQAQNILELVDDGLLYTRVDGIITNGKFMLMELELIEPVLFLEANPEATAAFVNGILN
jgi:hypothetical protein